MENKRKVSKAQQHATNNYIAKAYDRISIVVRKGEKEKIKAFAESQGESVNSFVTKAIYKYMELINED